MADIALIERKRAVWQSKPALRAVYTDYFRRMAAQCRPGNVLEIGAGGAPLREQLEGVVALDICHAPWLDVVGDAQALPFAADSFDNIAMLDVLHHLSEPLRFFREATRVVRPGGRIVLIEPAITPLSWPMFKLFHHEPVDTGVDPLAEEPLTSDDPEDANQAIPSLIFGRHRDDFLAAFPTLSLVDHSFLSLWAYPLSGGFRGWQLVPTPLVGPLLAVEKLLLPALGRLAAFRLFVVLERRP